MNLAMLNTLCAVLEHGSFTSAAQAVGCSPSAVSLQVKQMERYFGQPLFDRSTRRMAATPFARSLAGTVGEFAGRIQSLRARPGTAVAGRIRLGALNSMQSEVLPDTLHLLRARYPALQVVVSPLTNTNQLLAELKAGRLDVALMVQPETGGSRQLTWREMQRQPYVMLVPDSAAGSTPEELLEEYPWIGYDVALPGGRASLRYMRRLAPQTRCTMELSSMDAIVAMVSRGLGLSVIPRPRRPLLTAYAVREVDLGPKGPMRRLSLAWRTSEDGSRNITAVADAFGEAFDLVDKDRCQDDADQPLRMPAQHPRHARK